MTFKQIFKVISLIFAILSVVCLFLTNIYYQNRDTNYNTFNLINASEFKFFVLVIIILNIGTIITTLMSISYDENKIIPAVTMCLALVSFILAILLKQISAPNAKINRELWLNGAQLKFGAIIMIISLGLCFLSNAVITFRSFILKKNDDDFDNSYVENSEETDMETENNEDGTGTAIMEDINIIEDFKEKK